MSNIGIGSGKYQHSKIQDCKKCGQPRDFSLKSALCVECAKKYRKKIHSAYLARQREAKGDEDYLLDRQIKVLNWRGAKITKDQFYNLLKIQENKCAICPALEPGGRGNWHVDHNHLTGKIRGLLCTKCNLCIGYANDSIDILKNAIQYLEKHSTKS